MAERGPPRPRRLELLHRLGRRAPCGAGDWLSCKAGAGAGALPCRRDSAQVEAAERRRWEAAGVGEEKMTYLEGSFAYIQGVWT